MYSILEIAVIVFANANGNNGVGNLHVGDANRKYNNNMNFDADAMKIEAGGCESSLLHAMGLQCRIDGLKTKR